MNRRILPPLVALGVVLSTGLFAGRDISPVEMSPLHRDVQGQPAPLFNDNQEMTTVKHFGLAPDRGLPLTTIPMGTRGEMIVGANPKAWRTAFVLREVNMVSSNVFPEWLPVWLYGNTWWHLDDWRGMVWSKSSDSAGKRLEVTNGLDFLECTADNAATLGPPGSQFVCPEEPGVKVTIAGVQMLVTYPNGTQNLFEREGQGPEVLSDDGATGSRYALMSVSRLKDGTTDTYEIIKSYTRTEVTSNGRIVTGRMAADYMIGMITTWGSVPAAGGPSRPVSRTIWQWKDANAKTVDCKQDRAAEQCTSPLVCYDRLCDLERYATPDQECFAYRCDSNWYDASTWFPSSAFVSDCKQRLCGSPTADSCWNDENFCSNKIRPAGDWKLSKIILPGTIHPDTGRPPVFSFYYMGSKERQFKFLRLIEDNRGEFTATPGVGFNGSNRLDQKRPSAANSIQFGYEKVRLATPHLKMVSFETGYDRENIRFQHTNTGIFYKAWYKNDVPFQVSTPMSNSADGITTVTITDTHGIPTEKDIQWIGARKPSASNPCDSAVGCNIQLGVIEIRPPTGGAIKNEYGDMAPAANSRRDKLTKTIDVDGTEAVYDRDWNKFGRLNNFTVGCQSEKYEYFSGVDLFPLFPTKVTKFSGTTVTQTEEREICRPGGNCPSYELGNAMKRITTLAGGTTVTETTTAVPGSGEAETKVEETGGASELTSWMTGRDPLFGRPKKVATEGASTEGTQAVDKASATPDVTNCDPNSEYCGGVLNASGARTTTELTYYPEMPSADVTAALASIGVTPPNGGRKATASTTAKGGQRTNGAQTGTGTPDEAKDTTYEVWTGAMLTHRHTEDGATKTSTYKWGDATFAHTAGTGMKPNTNALLKRTDTIAVAGEQVTVGGVWNEYDTIGGPDEPNESYLGPKKRGHIKADGTNSVADFERLENSERSFAPRIGCPWYTVPLISGATCYVDEQCVCNGRCANTIPYTAGICVNLRTDPNLICRRSFIADPNVTRERFIDSYQSTHNRQWLSQQCTQPPCLSGTLGCDNPR
ncbi:MAG: hypothetical protein U0169_04085 [Polyangiaceae bacterium]